MLDELKKGDKVLTIGGMYGVVAGQKNGSVLLKVADNVTVEVTKAAVSSVLNKKDGDEKGGGKEKK